MAKGISLKRLHALEAEDIDITDSRPQAMQSLVEVSGEVMDTITEVFAGTGLLQAERKVKALLDARRAVMSAWDRAGRSYLEIGRALNTLDAQLHRKEEKLRLKAHFDRLFPFSDSIASQLRRVAEMVDTGRVSEQVLPGSYSAAYQIALLDPEELEVARETGLIRPNTSRAAVIAFRKARLASSAQVDLGALEAEARRLHETRKRMLSELLQMRRRSQEIARLLAPEE
jgi:hypothetical protein